MVDACDNGGDHTIYKRTTTHRTENWDYDGHSIHYCANSDMNFDEFKPATYALQIDADVCYDTGYRRTFNNNTIVQKFIEFYNSLL